MMLSGSDRCQPGRLRELASDIGVCVCVSGTSTCAMVACYGELRSLSTAATSLAWLGCCWVMSDHLNLQNEHWCHGLSRDGMMTVIHVCLFVCIFVSVCLCVCLYEMVTLMMLSGGGRCQPARLRRYRTDGNTGLTWALPHVGPRFI